MNNIITLNGYHFVEMYNHTFVRIFNQNVKSGLKNLFSSNEEANYSRSKNKFSVLKFICDDFRVEENNTFEFILFYKEPNVIMHFSQTESIHHNSTSTGYVPIHVDESVSKFDGLLLSNIKESYIDGISAGGYWWYSIGARATHTYNQVTGIPGPILSDNIIVNEVSLWIRIDSVNLIKKLPLLMIFCTIKYASKNHMSFIAFVIILLVC